MIDPAPSEVHGSDAPSRRWAKVGLLAATVAGLVVAAFLLRGVGLDQVLSAAASIGWGGFAIYSLYSFGVFWLLGAAWLASAPGEPISRLARFSWARLVRESVADLLPFAQIGGLIVGAQIMIDAGVARRRVYASMVVDLTTEMASQLVFTLVGLASMATILAAPSGAPIRPLVIGGAAAMLASTVLLAVGQRWALALARRISAAMLPGVSERVGAVEIELAAIYARRRRVVVASGMNLLAWVASAMGAWIVLRLIGHPQHVSVVVAIESVVFAVRSIAFVIPAAIGVQEAAYTLIMPLFGLPPEIGLALSLIKRAREMAMGLPTLIAWQLVQFRMLLSLRQSEHRSPSRTR